MFAIFQETLRTPFYGMTNVLFEFWPPTAFWSAGGAGPASEYTQIMDPELEKRLRGEIRALRQQLQQQAEDFQREIQRMRDEHHREMRAVMYVRLMDERRSFGVPYYLADSCGADVSWHRC